MRDIFKSKHTFDEKAIYNNFIAAEGHLEGDALLEARAILAPRNFADHFKDYPPLLDNIRYERSQAEDHLQRSGVGHWLLRHSSLNRPSPDHCELVKKLGLQYYAVSYNNGQKVIKHVLILHRPGWGWAIVSNAGYTATTVHPVFVGRDTYYLCFVDILLAIIRKANLCFANQANGYMTGFRPTFNKSRSKRMR